MKYLRRFNESLENPSIKILRQGFKTLIENTHLVAEQVEDNLDQFLEDLDLTKIESMFGRIVKFLGAGVFGAVFLLDNGKVLKITFDFHEAPFVYEYCKVRKTPGFVQVDDVFKIKFGESTAFIVVRDPIEVVKNMTEYKTEIEMAKKSMYDISPVWRGTHDGNFGIQNGEVVLYDGFCKKAKIDESKVPFLKINK